MSRQQLGRERECYETNLVEGGKRREGKKKGSGPAILSQPRENTLEILVGAIAEDLPGREAAE